MVRVQRPSASEPNSVFAPEKVSVATVLPLTIAAETLIDPIVPPPWPVREKAVARGVGFTAVLKAIAMEVRRERCALPPLTTTDSTSGGAADWNSAWPTSLATPEGRALP